MRYVIAASMLLGLLLGSNGVASAASPEGIYILSGIYGRGGHIQNVDVTRRLQELCGTGGSSCGIWCAQSSFGGRDYGRHTQCRVIYRCPDATTRSAEASRDEPILMRCRASDGDGE